MSALPSLFSFLRRKSPKPRPEFDMSELRHAARRLTGWSYAGTGNVDPQSLLERAAYEIDRLTDELESLRG